MFNRITGRLSQEAARIWRTVTMITRSGKQPEIADAIAYLQECSPDLGGSCWTDHGFEHEERTLSLSVIIPADNVEAYIVECMESVLRQEVSFPFEVIVVNDGSTDATGQILEKFKNDQRVTIIQQPNRGLSAARNTGIVCSKGQYLCFVDSDDELCEGCY